MTNNKTLGTLIAESLREKIIGKFVRKIDEDKVGVVNAIGYFELPIGGEFEIEILYPNLPVGEPGARQIHEEALKNYYVGDHPWETGASPEQLQRQRYRSS